jgi:hypothetical protein
MPPAAGRCVPHPPVAGRLRGACFAAPTQCSRALGQAAEADRFGPVLLGMLSSHLVQLALCLNHRQTGDGHRLAPRRIPPVLDVEIPSWASRSPHRDGLETRQLIREMSRDNPLWGAPRIHGELLRLGVDIGETSISKYMVRCRKPPLQTWRTFLENLKTMVSVDFLHGADHSLSGAVGLPGPGSRSSPDCPFRCDGASDCGMDHAATAGGVSLGQCTAFFTAGPRPHLRF